MSGKGRQLCSGVHLNVFSIDVLGMKFLLDVVHVSSTATGGGRFAVITIQLVMSVRCVLKRHERSGLFVNELLLF